MDQAIVEDKRGGLALLDVDPRKFRVQRIQRRFASLGFRIVATEGTLLSLAEGGVPAEPILKLQEGRPNIVDAIKNGEIQLVVNTPARKESIYDDSYIRKAAVANKVPYITTTAAAVAAAMGIEAIRKGRGTVRSLQEYHARYGR